MKKITLLLMTLVFIGTITAQRIDIDKYRIKVQTANYPQYDIPLSDRTFAVDYLGDEYFTESADNISIKNFKYEEENPKIIVKLKGRKFRKLKTDLKKSTSVKKNKEGKVISRKNSYVVNYGNAGSGYISLYGGEYKTFQYKTPKQLKNEAERKKKEEEKKRKAEAKKKAEKAKKKAEEKEEMDANPFLQGVSADVEEEEEEAESKEEKEKAFMTRNLNYTYNHKTRSFSTSSAAYKAANNNRTVAYEQDMESYKDYLSNAATNQLNKAFNYTKKLERASFRITDSKKHPENAKFIQAMEALKVILGKMRYNKPTTDIRGEVDPIIAYFDSVAKKYSASDKRGKKLRAAALYNMGKLYYYFEDAANLKEVANRLIRDDYREGDGKDFLELADLIEKRAEFYDAANRYPTIKEGEDDSENDEGAEIQDDENDSGN